MLILFTLVLARVSGLFAVAPVFSRGPLPARFKLLLGAAISLALIPGVDVEKVPGEGALVAAVLFGEFAIGLAIGLLVRLLVVSFQMAGAVMAFQMGFALANSFDPDTGQSAPVISTIHVSLVTLLFLIIEGHHFLIRALAASFQSFPIGSATDWAFLTDALLFSASEMYLNAAKVAAPVAGLLLLTNAMVGFINRVAPQLSIFNIGFPMTVFGGLLAVLAALPATARFFIATYFALETRLVDLLQA